MATFGDSALQGREIRIMVFDELSGVNDWLTDQPHTYIHGIEPIQNDSRTRWAVYYRPRSSRT